MSTDPALNTDPQPTSQPVRRARRHSDPEMHGITRDTRAANPSDAGWRVRLMKASQFVADRHFRDQAYGGSLRAQKAARCSRYELATEHGIVFTAACVGELAVLRRGAGLAQRELAQILRVSSAQIAKWERGVVPAAVLSLVGALLSRQVATTSTDVSGDDIRRIRTQVLKWTQQQLATELDRAYAAVGQWERGGRRAPGWVLVYLQAVNDGWNRVHGTESSGA
ncbi:transcriptional regulator [Pseudomonas sp. ANT_H14]|uniref:transcriptional regulator n=1 Tax=Pseudomonas sp. ANT_H14 TaxID=2597349 RepID=UPI0011EDAD63|nr:transcriptional regulator [Pseudomonas sp. ANT_H14]KAA0947141.1 transcriptional regulator [Pseudomonas sp. ANT_H14]